MVLFFFLDACFSYACGSQYSKHLCKRHLPKLMDNLVGDQALVQVPSLATLPVSQALTGVQNSVLHNKETV